MMRRLVIAITGLLLAFAPALAETAACPLATAVPADMPALSHAREAVAARQKLVIMAIGGTPTAGGPMGDPALGYPARMAAHLALLLPGVEVVVTNRAIPNRSARSMGARLPEELAQLRPDLVLWASGSREAVHKTDPAAYARVLTEGVAAIRAAGADPLLIDTQFAPGWAAIPALDDYREVIQTVAELTDTALFPRFRLMQEWHETRAIDLGAIDRAQQILVARRVFECVGEGLARMVARGLGK